MAGRPTAGSTSGILIGMCVAFGVALIALVLLVVLWANQEDLRMAADKAKRNEDLLMASHERSGALRAWVDAANERKSATRVMNEQLETLTKMVTNNAATPKPGIAGQIQTGQLQPLWDRIESDQLIDDSTEVVGQPLIQSLSSLYELYKQERQLRAQAQATIDQSNQVIEELTQANESLQQEFDEKVQELQQTLTNIKDEWAEFRREKEAQLAAIEEGNTERASVTAKERQELRDQLEMLGSELDKREQRAEELQKKIREFQILPQARMAARQADGEIMMAKPGEPSVFINLGQQDHLTLGLRFAVYPPDSGIPSSGEAKGAVEVAKIGDEVSESRIVWMNPLNPILEGDLIANPIYDRDRRLSFIVLGSFDLDYDGNDDPYGRETIEAVIRDGGGVIADELTARTDFVIVGARPYVRPLSGDASAEEQAVHQEQQERYKEYYQNLKEARSLSIPLFTQETFLNFLGRRG